MRGPSPPRSQVLTHFRSLRSCPLPPGLRGFHPLKNPHLRRQSGCFSHRNITFPISMGRFLRRTAIFYRLVGRFSHRNWLFLISMGIILSKGICFAICPEIFSYRNLKSCVSMGKIHKPRIIFAFLPERSSHRNPSF